MGVGVSGVRLCGARGVADVVAARVGARAGALLHVLVHLQCDSHVPRRCLGLRTLHLAVSALHGRQYVALRLVSDAHGCGHAAVRHERVHERILPPFDDVGDAEADFRADNLGGGLYDDGVPAVGHSAGAHGHREGALLAGVWHQDAGTDGV